MTGLRRALAGAASTGLGLLLLLLLFSSLPVSLGDALVATISAPLWLYGVVIVCTFANQVVGALKWQAAADYIARPTPRPGFWRRVELTSLGAVFGQILPVQLSTLLVRWICLDREVRASGYVARATFFEQTFDLILVLAGSVAAIAIVGFGLPPGPALVTMACVVGASLVALRSFLRVGAAVFRRLADLGLWAAGSAAEGCAHAAAAPARVRGLLSFYSALRLILVAARAVAILAVFAPQTSSWLVFVASPPIALLTALPIAPAGLGIAEWSWSAVLVAGGTAAPAAAIAALNVRLTSMMVLVAIAGLLTAGRLLDGRRAQPRERSA